MEKANHKETIIVIAAGFLVLYLLFDIDWLLYISLIVLIIGIISQALSEYIHRAWFWLAEKLGWVMSKIVLGIIFLFVLLPIGLISKLFRKDIMMLKKRKDSYFHIRNHSYEAEDMKDPF